MLIDNENFRSTLLDAKWVWVVVSLSRVGQGDRGFWNQSNPGMTDFDMQRHPAAWPGQTRCPPISNPSATRYRWPLAALCAASWAAPSGEACAPSTLQGAPE
jgi:hypothetical protein